MKKFIVIFSLFILLPVSAQVPDEKEALKKFEKEQEEGMAKEEEAFRQYSAEVTKQYSDYLAEQERLFKEYTGAIGKKWGKKQVKTSTREEYVAYDAQYGSRRSVNFEEGKAKVEILMTEAEAKDPKKVQEKLKQQVAQLAVDKGGSDPLEKQTNVSPEKRPIVAGQLQTPDGKPVTERTAGQFAEQSVQPALVTQQLVTGADGLKRVIVGVQIPLVPDHVKKRATEFRGNVRSQATRFGIDVTLVFAIMHTESYFNPKAKSPVPAFGLMQLVPKSGARDAFFFAHKKDSLVTGEYLFVAENNIELGTAYLTKLLTVDFRGVTDIKSRMYCAISAYNTGPGNVAKAFTGKRNVTQALPKINAMTSDEVFAHLRKNLPFEETRTYIVKVSERMGMYSEWSE